MKDLNDQLKHEGNEMSFGDENENQETEIQNLDLKVKTLVNDYGSIAPSKYSRNISPKD